MKKLGIQLYSLGEGLGADYLGSLKKIVEFGYHHVETAGCFVPDIAQTKKWFDELGITVSSIHTGCPAGENRDAILRQAETLEYRDIIIAGLPASSYATVEKAKDACDYISKGVREVAKQGYRLGYHNHDYEMNEVASTGKCAYDFLIAECDPELFFEVDAYWAQVGGQDPVSLIKSLGERCRFLHIKDGSGKRGESNLAVGTGIMDWTPVIDAAQYTANVYVEIDWCKGDRMAIIKSSAEYLIEKEYAK